MMKYIINNAYGSLIYIKDKIVNSNKTNLSIIKELCYKYLFSYEGYLKAVKKAFNEHYQIPLYLDNENIFIPSKRVRDYENIWINWASVISYEIKDNQIRFIFYDKTSLLVEFSLFKLHRQLKLINDIKSYKASLITKIDYE